MDFVRGRPPESTVWQNFRSVTDGFVFGVSRDVCEVRIHTNADRSVELFLALAANLPPAVEVSLEDWRSARLWAGTALATSDVLDAIARVKGTLTSYAGAEISLIGQDEQLTLTANLALYIYSRSDRWLYLLQGMGLKRLAALRQRSWTLRRGEFAASREAEAAVNLTIERIGLREKTRGADEPSIEA
jgi:hypothetical protein